MSTKIKIKKVHAEATIPHYSRKGDAGMDIYSIEEATIKPRERKLLPTGLSFEIPEDYEIQVRPKSGLALNFGLTILNTPGTLDSGYRGELKILLFNTGDKEYYVKKGEKIAQIVLAKYETAEVEEVDNLSESERGSGGFGSTGLTISK